MWPCIVLDPHRFVVVVVIVIRFGRHVCFATVAVPAVIVIALVVAGPLLFTIIVVSVAVLVALAVLAAMGISAIRRCCLASSPRSPPSAIIRCVSFLVLYRCFRPNPRQERGHICPDVTSLSLLPTPLVVILHSCRRAHDRPNPRQEANVCGCFISCS